MEDLLATANASSVPGSELGKGSLSLFPLECLGRNSGTAVATALLCQLVYLSSFSIFDTLSKIHRTLSPAKKIDWASRVVSSCFAIYAVSHAFVALGNPDLRADKLFAHTPEAEHLMGVALGYFLWDIVICTQHIKLFGAGFLVHAICCVNIYLWIMRPCLMYFGVKVLLWEMSVGCLNLPLNLGPADAQFHFNRLRF
jgi:hypothetical protein